MSFIADDSMITTHYFINIMVWIVFMADIEIQTLLSTILSYYNNNLH